MDRTVLARDGAWASQRAPLLASASCPRTSPPTGPVSPRKFPVTAEGSRFHGSRLSADPARRNVSCPLRSSCLQARNAASPGDGDPGGHKRWPRRWGQPESPPWAPERAPRASSPRPLPAQMPLGLGDRPPYKVGTVALGPARPGGRPQREGPGHSRLRKPKTHNHTQ